MPPRFAATLSYACDASLLLRHTSAAMPPRRRCRDAAAIDTLSNDTRCTPDFRRRCFRSPVYFAMLYLPMLMPSPRRCCHDAAAAYFDYFTLLPTMPLF